MLKLLLVLSTAFVGLDAAAASGFLVEPTGQATGSTCQSYALATALAFKKNPAFPLQTAADLRNVETAIRREITKVAGNDQVSHDHIRAGFENYTNGAYKLKFTDVELAAVGEQVGTRSGVTSRAALPPNFLIASVVKDVILASATKIDGDSYAGGHIFTMLGVDGPSNSNQQLLVLNSAVKVKNQTFLCQDGVPDDPGPYTALLSWKAFNGIRFKEFGGKVRLWRVEK